MSCLMIVGAVQNSRYRFGFNGMEMDNEIYGDGGSYTTEFRQYDPRLGRWLSIDPLAEMFVDWTPYHYVHNNPLILIDPTGMSAEETNSSNSSKVNVVIISKNIPKTDLALIAIKSSIEDDLDKNVIKIYTTGLDDLKQQLDEKLKGKIIGTVSNHVTDIYIKIAFLFMILAVMASRILLKRHFITDIIGGFVIGALIWWISTQL